MSKASTDIGCTFIFQCLVLPTLLDYLLGGSSIAKRYAIGTNIVPPEHPPG
jgi:hypothetical protein